MKTQKEETVNLALIAFGVASGIIFPLTTPKRSGEGAGLVGLTAFYRGCLSRQATDLKLVNCTDNVSRTHFCCRINSSRSLGGARSMTGKTISHYTILDKIEEGGMQDGIDCMAMGFVLPRAATRESSSSRRRSAPAPSTPGSRLSRTPQRTASSS